MENKKLVVGNMKMNMILDDIIPYLKKANSEITSENVVICPSNIYIPYFLKQKYKVGIQNIFHEDQGAYTGEVSASQASSMGIEYVIIGHSERRQLMNEKEHEINKKVIEALKHHMKVILCIGETKEEKDLLRTTIVLKKQLHFALKGIKDLRNVIIAYEPIWSIGTNEIPTVKDISTTAFFIKEVVKEYSGYSEVNVLYGGSVNEKNINEIININEISGVLVGGASTDFEKFKKIIEAAS